MQCDWEDIELCFGDYHRTGDDVFCDKTELSCISVYINFDKVLIDVSRGHDGAAHILTRDEAIAAARAILKHFDAIPGPVGKGEW